MFSCCCANKKALKKAAVGDVGTKDISSGDAKPNANNSIRVPNEAIHKPAATDVHLCKPPILNNDKSNSSEEDNNLSGLIMSDGLVGNVLLIFMSLTSLISLNVYSKLIGEYVLLSLFGCLFPLTQINGNFQSILFYLHASHFAGCK